MYQCLKSKIFIKHEYKITSLSREDILAIKEWRNEQIEILRQDKPLTDEDQFNYYHNVIEPTFKEPFPRQILFSFFKNDVLIGYGGIVHISWADKRGEISFLLETKRIKDPVIYENDFRFFLKLIKEVAFEDLGLNRIFTETFDIRPLHISILQNNGFVYEGRMKQHVIIADQFVDSLIHGCLYEGYIKE
jgi:RimJ/RimL family protein N-acetyltransferase